MRSIPAHTRRRARPWLGTLVDITLQGDEEALLAATMEACFAAVERVHLLMSFHDAASDVSRLNREAAMRSVKVAAEVAKVLQMAKNISAQSDGLFDITVAARLCEHGHLPPGSSGNHSPPPDPDASWKDIVIGSDDRIKFRRPLLIDLGGIAKGFAVDQALDVCHRAGPQLRAARINAGGDLARYGEEQGQIGQRIQIRHPLDQSRLFDIDAGNCPAIASSVYADGNPVHLVPAGFQSQTADAAPFIGATVLASSCMVADALTKVVMLDSGGAIAAHCLDFFAASAMVIDRQSRVLRNAAAQARLAYA
ncbi:MAG TPA: FAD:protein FMN transferase [Usitatibacteraceae bacterium]